MTGCPEETWVIVNTFKVDQLVITENTTCPYAFGICSASNAYDWWWITSEGGIGLTNAKKEKAQHVVVST
jgi:hypothetical protein